MVKGSCSQVVEKVAAKISSIPQGLAASAEPKTLSGFAKVFDDFLDKDRRKNNLVIHNLPEDNERSREDRAAQDVSLFQEIVKEVFRMSIAVAKAVRVGKQVANRDRLLIVTLETPGVKQDLLRMAPQLRASQKFRCGKVVSLQVNQRYRH